MPDETVIQALQKKTTAGAEATAKWLGTTLGVLMSAGTFIGFIAGTLLWMQATFADAGEVQSIKAYIIQMEINSAKKERRSLKRDLRRADEQDEKDDIKDDLDEVEDVITDKEKEKQEVLDDD